MDAQTRAAYEHMLDRLVQQHAESRRASQSDREMQMRGSQFDRSLTSKEQEELAQRGERFRQFDLTEKYRQDALRSAERDRHMQMLLNRRKAEGVSTDREAQSLLPQINEWSSQGGGSNPDVSEQDFKATFPKSVWNYSGFAVQQARKAREALKSLYHADLADAQTMSQDASYQHMIDAEGKSSWNPDNAPKARSWTDSKTLSWLPWDRSNTPDQAAIKDWTTSKSELAAPVAAIRADRNRIGRLVPNENGGYDAVAPPWMQAVATRPGQPGSVQPAPAPTSANPYVVGKLYQGNIRYKGGDPGDQNSWQQE